jgi:hypothetical protein
MLHEFGVDQQRSDCTNSCSSADQQCCDRTNQCDAVCQQRSDCSDLCPYSRTEAMGWVWLAPWAMRPISCPCGCGRRSAIHVAT